jgi:HEAT repeat protein
MYRIKIIILIILKVVLLFSCSSTSRLSDDEIIQNNIKRDVNNYNSPNWETRLRSIKSVSKYSESIYAKNSTLLVIKALDDSHSAVRIEALKILRKIKAPAAEEKIRTIALGDINSNARYYAFSALGEYRNIKNESFFLKGLENRDWLIREAALIGLMGINDPEIQIRYIDIILNAMKDKNVSIKLACISNLAIKDPLIYSELSKIINNKNSSLYLLKAALKQIKGYKIDDKTKNRVISLLTHRDKKIRILSLQVLKMEEIIIPL